MKHVVKFLIGSLIGATVIFALKENTFGGINAGILPTVKGALNPTVTQNTINSTICVSGWTATIRPTTRLTDAIKATLARKQGVKAVDYELDHAVSLQLGGSPDSLDNLWLEPYNIKYGARQKDVVETYLKREICAGRMSLFVGQRLIMNSWDKIYDDIKAKPVFGGIELDMDDD